MRARRSSFIAWSYPSTLPRRRSSRLMLMSCGLGGLLRSSMSRPFSAAVAWRRSVPCSFDLGFDLFLGQRPALGEERRPLRFERLGHLAHPPPRAAEIAFLAQPFGDIL